MTDRAQSITLGFVFVFALVLGAMGLLTVAGMAELSDVRDAERLNNAELAFETLDSNAEDLVTDALPSQATEVSLASARLYYGEPITVSVSGVSVADASQNFSYTITARPIVYETEGGSGTKLVYAAGHVFRQQRAGTVMLDELDVLLSSERTNLLVVQTRAGRTSGIGGSTTALVRMVRAESVLYQVNRSTYDVTVTIDSPRAVAWHRQLAARSVTSCSLPSDRRVRCSLRTDELYLTVARVDVALE